MTNADLVWRLVELLLQEKNSKNQVALDQYQDQKAQNKQDDKSLKRYS